MVITQNDVNNDMKLISESIEDINRPLVSPSQALKLAMLWPGLCIGGYFVAAAWMLITFTVPNDGSIFNQVDPLIHYIGGNLAFFALALGFALAIGGGLYGPALFYLTIPDEVRKNSILIRSLKKTARRSGVFFLVCNLALAGLALFYRDALFGAPFLLIISFLIVQGIVSAEMTRFGIAPVMKKLISLTRKI